MVEVIINGINIDLISTEVKYTKQVNDLADISTVNCSYTYTLEAKKTPKNTRLFNQLGMVGDTSKFPYLRNSTQLIDNGAVLVKKGITTIKKTESDRYRIYVQDGVIDVFKLIENKTVGDDLSLTELEHNKTSQTIIDSWQSGSAYRYLIADYNGQTYDGQAINAQYQIPSVNYKYLWDKVMDYIGYTYSGDFSFIENLWISYPKPPEIQDQQLTPIFLANSVSYQGSSLTNAYKQFNNISIQDGVVVFNNWRVQLSLTGNYNIAFNGLGTANYSVYPIGTINNAPYKIELLSSGDVKGIVFSNIQDDEFDFNGTIQSNSQIELRVSPLSPEDFQQWEGYSNLPPYFQSKINSGDYSIDQVDIVTLNLAINTYGTEVIDFQNVLKGLSIKDFFKETMFRGAMTPFVDNVLKHIDFLSLNERISTNQSNIIDFSDKYVSREEEEYIYSNYAQKNKLKFKYNDEEDSYFDSAIYVDNKNIKDEKDLFVSRFYAPDEKPNQVTIAPNETETMIVARMWEKEISENTDGDREIKYKPLNNHFYLFGEKYVNNTININNDSNSGFYKAVTSGTTFPEVTNNKYNQIERIFTDTRIHSIKLALSAYEVSILNLKKLYYFNQEAQLYILNRLIFETGKLSTGEFLRIKK